MAYKIHDKILFYVEYLPIPVYQNSYRSPGESSAENNES